MKRVLAVFGVAAACAACCAIPLALPLLAGLTASGLGLATLGWQAAVALVVATGALGFAIVLHNRRRSRARAAATASGQSCDCPPASCAGGSAGTTS
jgi:UPF0716 family protein affecting phage T7 exclusion